MTEKRFYYAHGIIFDTHKDNHINKIGTIKDLDIGLRIVNWLNELNDENEKLKIQLQNTSDQRDEFHRGARENANRVGKLEKENEQLKKQLTHLTMYKNLFREFQKQLDGVKKKSDLDHKDFEDLIELTKGHVFDDEHGWIWLPINDR